MSDVSLEDPSLQRACDDDLITDVLHVIKSGKEATVYCCRAHPRTGHKLLAAKVYRPLEYRRFRNDAVYRSARVILDRRLRRAVRRKTRTGRGVQFGRWMGNEFETLQILHGAGADVPQPVALCGSAVLMEYVGAERSPARTLNKVKLAPDEAEPLFARLMRNVELWLAHHRVHADLSAFNILYWKGRMKVIDFPQAVDPRLNPSSFMLLLRDVDHVCGYFSRFAVQANPHELAEDLWTRYLRDEL